MPRILPIVLATLALAACGSLPAAERPECPAVRVDNQNFNRATLYLAYNGRRVGAAEGRAVTNLRVCVPDNVPGNFVIRGMADSFLIRLGTGMPLPRSYTTLITIGANAQISHIGGVDG